MMTETDKAYRLERILLTGFDAEAALGGAVAVLDARGIDDPELRGYIDALETHLARIVETAEGVPAQDAGRVRTAA